MHLSLPLPRAGFNKFDASIEPPLVAPAPSAKISGFSGGSVENEDWLISNPVNLGGLSSATLTFQSVVRYSGPELTVYIGTDYNEGNPNDDGNWDLISATLDTDDTSWSSWTDSGNIDLSFTDTSVKFTLEEIDVSYTLPKQNSYDEYKIRSIFNGNLELSGTTTDVTNGTYTKLSTDFKISPTFNGILQEKIEFKQNLDGKIELKKILIELYLL